MDVKPPGVATIAGDVATPGGVEEVLRLIATIGDQLDLVALADKYAVRLVGPPLLADRNASSQ